jgi:hypothetical protein
MKYIKYIVGFSLGALLFVGLATRAQTIPSVSPFLVDALGNITQRISGTPVKINGNLTVTGTCTGCGGGGGAVSSVFSRTGAVTAQSGDYNTSQVPENTNLYFTNARAQNAITVTTTGTSGASTYSGGTLNIPNYATGAGFITSLTTSGTSGAATVVSGVLNVPQYTGGAAFGYPFPSNATSTLLTFSGGLNLSNLTAGTVNVGAGGALYNTATTSIGVASPLTVTGTLGALIGGTNSTINCLVASGSQAGCIASADWTTFNNKQSALTFSTGLTNTAGTITVNVSQNISTLSNLTSNGLIKTSGGTGALSIATAGTDYQAPITLTTTGTSGAATFAGNTLNVPNYATGAGYITSITTTGTSGAATVVSGVLNVPQYSGSGGTPGGASSTIQYNANGAFAGGNIFTDGTSLGIGTSSPFAALSISTTPGTTLNQPNLFAISSSTAGVSTTTLFSITNTGSINDYGNDFNYTGASGTGLRFDYAGVPKLQLSSSVAAFTPGSEGNSGGAASGNFQFTPAANLSMPASLADYPEMVLNFGHTNARAIGAVANVNDFKLLPSIEDFSTGGSLAATTIASSTSLYIAGTPTPGHFANITNTYGIFIGATTTPVSASTTNSYGLLVQASIGAVNNFAASFLGLVGIGTTNPNSTLQVAGSFSRNTRSVAVATTLLSSDDVLVVTAAYATTTLPTAVGITGREYIIKNATTGSNLVNTTSSQTIFTASAVTTLTLMPGDSLQVISDGANWQQI